MLQTITICDSLLQNITSSFKENSVLTPQRTNNPESYNRDRFLEAFSKRLVKAIQEAGLNLSDQDTLAQQFGVSRPALRKWLEGKTLPSTTRLPAIADKLKVRHGWLTTGEPPMRTQPVSIVSEPTPALYSTHNSTEHSITQDELDFLREYRKLSSETQTLLQQLFVSLNHNL